MAKEPSLETLHTLGRKTVEVNTAAGTVSGVIVSVSEHARASNWTQLRIQTARGDVDRTAFCQPGQLLTLLAETNGAQPNIDSLIKKIAAASPGALQRDEDAKYAAPSKPNSAANGNRLPHHGGV